MRGKRGTYLFTGCVLAGAVWFAATRVTTGVVAATGSNAGVTSNTLSGQTGANVIAGTVPPVESGVVANVNVSDGRLPTTNVNQDGQVTVTVTQSTPAYGIHLKAPAATPPDQGLDAWVYGITSELNWALQQEGGGKTSVNDDGKPGHPVKGKHGKGKTAGHDKHGPDSGDSHEGEGGDH